MPVEERYGLRIKLSDRNDRRFKLRYPKSYRIICLVVWEVTHSRSGNNSLTTCAYTVQIGRTPSYLSFRTSVQTILVLENE